MDQAGRRARDGPARAAAEELHPQGGLPGRGRDRRRLRLRRLRTARSTSCSRNLDLDAFRREQEELRAQGHLPRHRLLDLHGDLRPRAVARGRARAASASRPASGSPRSCACTRPARRRCYTGTLAARPGPRDRLRPDRGRPLGITPDAGRGHPRRHRHRPVRHGHLRLALAGGGRRVARPARRTRWPTRPSGSSRTCSRPRPRTSSCADGKYQVKGSPDKGHDARRGRAAPPTSPRTCPRAWSPGWRRRRSTTRRTSSGPFGAHACVVDVDAETGKVEVVRYVARRRLRPGDQPDADRRPGPRRHRPRASARRSTSRSSTTRTGQLVTGTFVGLRAAHARPRCRPSRPTAPRRRRRSTRSASRASARRARSPPRPAVVNAVIDALRPLGVTYIDMPLSPMRVWEAIQEAGKA